MENDLISAGRLCQSCLIVVACDAADPWPTNNGELLFGIRLSIIVCDINNDPKMQAISVSMVSPVDPLDSIEFSVLMLSDYYIVVQP